MDFKPLSNLLGLTLSSAPYRLVVHARAIGYEARAHLECAGASRTDERRDSRRVDSPRSVQPDPRRSSQSDDRHVSIHVHSRILRAVGGGAARACRASYRFNYLFNVRTPSRGHIECSLDRANLIAAHSPDFKI